MNEAINSIIRGDLRPDIEDKKDDDFYMPEFRLLDEIKENFIAHFKIKFVQPLMSGKVQYYKRMIDNIIAAELNNQFYELYGGDDAVIAFRRKKMLSIIETFLKDIFKTINRYNYDINVILSPRVNYSVDLRHKECTYIFHYLILALIRCYMEFQAHFKDFIETDKQLSIEYFFVRILRRPMPDNIGIEKIQTIEMDNALQIEKEIAETSISIQTLQSKYDTFMTVVSPYNFLELPKMKCLSAEKQKELVLNLVKDIPYAIAMIEFLEYPQYLANNYEGMKTKSNQYKHIAKALCSKFDTVKGHFIALRNPSSNKAINYSSHQYTKIVKNDYQNIRNK
jgi:hypothetical protein